MVKKYFDFINESIEILLESDVRYSEKFRKVLKKIGGSVSDALLNIENKDYPVQSNYFDVTDGNDTISFTPDRKVKEILDKNKGKWAYMISGKYLSAESQFQYLWDALDVEREDVGEPPVGTMGTIGKEATSPRSGKRFVVFIPDDTNYKPIPVNIDALSIGGGNSDFFKTSRQTIRVGRGIRAILNSAKAKVTDKEVEEFVNKYKATIDSLNDIFSNFELVNGDSIAEWYNYERYEKGTEKGTLGSSCMADVNSNFFDIYCSNPDKISLVIYKCPEDNSKIRGRALVWKLNNGKTFMDRIYTHEDSDVELFRQYAKKNNMYSKVNNSSTSSGNCFRPDDDLKENLNLEVSLKPGRYDKYPYLDTLKYYNPSSGLIHNDKGEGECELEDTGGGFSECDSCGGNGTMDCPDCNGNGEEECSECNGRGQVECSECEGTSEVDCDQCSGSGTTTNANGDDSECDKCDGSGKMECTKCDGDGETECRECNGRGEFECNNCDGNGTVDCPECG